MFNKILKISGIDEKYHDKVSEYLNKYSNMEANEFMINKISQALYTFRKLDLSKIIFIDDSSICEDYKLSIDISSFDEVTIPISNVGYYYDSLISEEISQYINNIINKDGGIVINELYSKILDNKNNITIHSNILSLPKYRLCKLNKIKNNIID